MATESRLSGPKVFTAAIVVITLFTGVLALVYFGKFVSAAIDFFPLDSSAGERAANRPLDAWCRAERAYRPFVKTIDEATIGGRAFAGKAQSFGLAHLAPFVEEERDPTQIRADFAIVKRAVIPSARAAPAHPAPLAPSKARIARAAAARLDRTCTSVGA